MFEFLSLFESLCSSCLFELFVRVELSHVETTYTSHSLRRIVLWIQEDNKAWRKGKGDKDASEFDHDEAGSPSKSGIR